MIVSDVTAKVLERVYSVIKSRANSDPETSYVAALNHSGLTKVAEKFGEEAIETVISAVTRNRDQTIHESADLLFMLMVLWAQMDISPEEIFAELTRREGTSGHQEKQMRDKG